jgi:hypothetical protein
MNLKDLAAPFAADKIHWRVGATTADKSKGIALAYIDARDVMERLDAVVGPENWQCEYPFEGCCRIGILCGDHWVWKSNGAGETAVEGEKGRFSDAFKRAAVLWGVGRYLYDLPNVWVPLVAKGRTHVIQTPPQLPQWALPGPAVSTGENGRVSISVAPPSPEDEAKMYLASLCRDKGHDVDEVIRRGNAAGKTIDEIIAIYEGMS